MAYSLVRVLTVRLLIITGFALLISANMLWWQFEHSSAIVLDRGLGETIETIESHLTIDADGRPRQTLPADTAAEFDDLMFFTVSDEHGNTFLSLPEGFEHAYHPFEAEETSAPQYFEHNYLHSGENYLGVTRAIELGGQTYWLQLVKEVPYWQNFLHYSLEVFLHGVGALVILHFLGSAFLAWTTIRASFEPVAQAARRADEIVPGRSNARITVPDLPAEVVPLTNAVDTALDRLDAALASQQRLTADIAHELLTPVAVMKARVETMENRDDARLFMNDIDEITSVVRQLLELSELEASDPARFGPFDIYAVAVDVVARLAPLAIHRGIEPELVGEGPVMVTGCPKAIGRAITNLVQNAIVHGSGATRLRVEVDPRGVVRVIDNGSGVREELREEIFERFRRTPGKSVPGTGLGLAIVRRVAEAHNGRAYVTDGPDGGGACFVLELGASPA